MKLDISGKVAVAKKWGERKREEEGMVWVCDRRDV